MPSTSPRQRLPRHALAAIAALAVQACGGGSDGTAPEAVVQASPAMVRLQAEAVGLNCPGGGTQVLAGLDTNSNGVLDSTEVASTQYVCSNGIGSGAGVRATLVALASESPGANCAAGGTKVSAGLDANGDRVLDAEEVASATYVCGGVAGPAGASGTIGASTLMAMAAEAAGAHCAWGGSRITAGLDVNRNGVLDVGEVTSTQYACNGAPGFGITWVATNAAAVQTQGNTGYVAQGAQATVFTLPASPSVGDTIRVVGAGSGGWRLLQGSGQSIVTASLASTLPGAVWTPRATAQAWRAIASSSNGSRLVAAVNGGFIYVSHDAGATWSPRDSQRMWWSVASSAGGQKLAATTFGDQIFVSDDGGDTWQARDFPHQWSNIAMSSDGSRMVATEYSGSIYTSTDGGLTWTPGATFDAWTAVASSADGRTLAAVAYGGRIHVSTDGGATWTPQGPTKQWFSVAMSADGRRIVAAEQGGSLHVSTDVGVTWTPVGQSANWSGLASSADGQHLAASNFGGFVHVSSDGGLTWTARESVRDWNGVAMSADGMRLAAAAYNGGFVYTSTASTSLGTTGSISGLQDESIDLQYLGSGRFLVTGHVGSPTVY